MTIQEICRRTGLTADVLRAWERRYGALKPKREENKRRRYSHDDLRRALLLAQAVRSGHAISEIAQLDDAAIRALAGCTPADDDATVTKLIVAVRDYDGESLERTLLEASEQRTAEDFCDAIVTPLLHEVGAYWLRDASLIAKEHLASSAVAAVLDRRIRQSATSGGRIVVFATMPSERHVIGAAMAACVAAQHGLRPVILGAGSAPAEIADVARRLRAAGVGVSVVYQPAEHTLRDLAAALGGMPLWVGGSAAAEGPWHSVASMSAFGAALNAL